MRIRPGKTLKYLLLTAGAVGTIFPFFWMISTSLKSPLEVLSAQISLVPSLKKYIPGEGGEQQVEFAWLAEAEKLFTGAEGNLVKTLGEGEEARRAAEALDRARRELPGAFGRGFPREKVAGGIFRVLGDVRDALQSLQGAEARVIGDELDSLEAALEGLDREAVYGDEEVALVCLTGGGRGRTVTVKPERIAWRRFLWSNYPKAWGAAPFGRYFFNSIVMSLAVTIGQVLTSALAAYAFARMRFKGKEVLFLVLLATMMVPNQVILIPNYAILSQLNWINTYYVLIVPFLGAVFGIYFLRQHFQTLPQDLFDAASLDGCGEFRTLFTIVLPLSRGVLITVSIFTFIMIWNSLLWPLVMTNTPEMRPLQVGLAVFNQESGTDWEMLMSASTFAILPLIAVFFMAQKQFIEGITRSGMKD